VDNLNIRDHLLGEFHPVWGYAHLWSWGHNNITTFICSHSTLLLFKGQHVRVNVGLGRFRRIIEPVLLVAYQVVFDNQASRERRRSERGSRRPVDDWTYPPYSGYPDGEYPPRQLKVHIV
jgi:hypothetical protein